MCLFTTGKVNWFHSILTVLPERNAKNRNANIDDLLPWNEKVMEVCKYKK